MTIEKLNNGAMNIAAMSLMDFTKELIEVSKQGYELDLTVEAGVPQNIGYLYVCTLFPTSTEEQDAVTDDEPADEKPVLPEDIDKVSTPAGQEHDDALQDSLGLPRIVTTNPEEPATQVSPDPAPVTTEAPKASKGGRPAGSKNKQ